MEKRRGIISLEDEILQIFFQLRETTNCQECNLRREMDEHATCELSRSNGLEEHAILSLEKFRMLDFPLL